MFIEDTKAPTTELPITYADILKFGFKTGYKPRINAKEGVNLFLDWYIKYYNYKI